MGAGPACLGGLALPDPDGPAHLLSVTRNPPLGPNNLEEFPKPGFRICQTEGSRAVVRTREEVSRGRAPERKEGCAGARRPEDTCQGRGQVHAPGDF